MRSRVMVFLLLVSSLPALGASLRQGNEVVIAPDELITEDLYLAGGTVKVLGTVHGDLIAIGGTVTVEGDVIGDVLAAGGSVIINGRVGGSIRAWAGEVRLRGSVGEDLVVAAGQLTLAPGAELGRDLLAGAGQVKVEAPVGRDVWMAGGSLDVASAVGRDVRAQVGSLTLSKGAHVAGALSYTSPSPALLTPGTSVTGPTTYTVTEGTGWTTTLYRWFRGVVGLLALALVWRAAFPAFARRAEGALRASPWRSLGYGAICLFGVPVASMAIFALGVVIGGWWLGAIAMGILAVASALGFALVGSWVGALLLKTMPTARPAAWLAALLGVSLLMAVSLVPVLGAAVVVATSLLGVGALAVSLRGRLPMRVEGELTQPMQAQRSA